MQTLYRVTIGVLVALILFMIFWPDKKTAVPDVQTIQNSEQEAALSFQVECLRADNEALRDSIFGLTVDKGHIEVELNKSRSQLDEMLKNNKQYKVKRDTIKQVSNCDSIVYLLGYNFLPISDTLQRLGEIIDSMKDRRFIYFDSMDTKHESIKILLTQDLITERTTNAVITNKLEKKKKQTLLSFIGGIIVGLITAISLHK